MIGKEEGREEQEREEGCRFGIEAARLLGEATIASA